MSGLDAYQRESGEMVKQLGFWSEEFRRFRDWWQQNTGASAGEVERVAGGIWRERGTGSRGR